MRAVVFTALALVAAVGACSPYGPDLGDDPFLCGPDAPRCPDGYDAITVNAGASARCECHRTGSSTTADGDYTCNNDPIEHNDTVQQATPTAIGTLNTTAYNNVAVCPGTDSDFYSMDIIKVGTQIRVDVTYDQTRPTPSLDILNASGASLNPTLAANTPGKLTATVTASATGRSYAVVKAGTGGKSVNYSINFMTIPPP